MMMPSMRNALLLGRPPQIEIARRNERFYKRRMQNRPVNAA